MTDEQLLGLARQAAAKAYAPYSNFHVGCAIESVDGEVVLGANMENACYRLGICAEISALTAARQAFGLEINQMEERLVRWAKENRGKN